MGDRSFSVYLAAPPHSRFSAKVRDALCPWGPRGLHPQSHTAESVGCVTGDILKQKRKTRVGRTITKQSCDPGKLAAGPFGEIGTLCHTGFATHAFTTCFFAAIIIGVQVTAQISEKTGHLPGVAIAIMGCIVNGVGEMADADFGYVGGAPGKVDLYVGKELVQKGIPNEQACDALIDLIKANDRWVDKEPAEEVVAA